MDGIYGSILDIIGNTPLVELSRYGAEVNCRARIIAKLERANPAGSIKDRTALAIIRDAEERGALPPGGTIIEATSGNTGVGLAAVSAVLGYKTVIVMPDSMSVERRQLMGAYGAELVLTPGAEGMKGAIKRAEELHEKTPGSIIAGQFGNPANPDVHYKTTGPEIMRDTKELAAFVSGVGTGGTITGAGRFIKERSPKTQIVAVEPESSPVLSGGRAAPHKIQGIGAGFVPEILDLAIIDEIICVSNEEALNAARALARAEGILVGISSGAAVAAAVKLGERPEFEGKIIVVILPDTGERYLSVL